MRIEARIFLILTPLFLLFAVIYGIWTHARAIGGLEVAGFAALILSGGLSGLIGSYFWFVSRRIEARPEDRSDAEIAEGAGELGFFSPGSYWPLGIAASATVIGLGICFLQYWLMATGVVLLLITIGGLLFEYYIGQREPLREPVSHQD